MNIATPDVLQTIDRNTLPPLSSTPSVQSKISTLVASQGPLAGTGSGNPFGSVLEQRQAKLQSFQDAAAHTPDADEKARRKTAEDAASGLVSNALILPVLKQLRRSAWGGEGVFSGGIGEKTFGPEFDMQLADRIAQSPRLGIKVALANRMMKKAPPAVKKNGLDVHG